MRVIASAADAAAIGKILEHLATRRPPRTPARLIVFGYVVERVSLRLGQVAEERKDDAVALNDGVTVHLGPRR